MKNTVNNTPAPSVDVPRHVSGCCLLERTILIEELSAAGNRIKERLKVSGDEIRIECQAVVRVADEIISQDVVIGNYSQEITGIEKETFKPGRSGGLTGSGAGTGSASADTDPETTIASEVSGL